MNIDEDDDTLQNIKHSVLRSAWKYICALPLNSRICTEEKYEQFLKDWISKSGVDLFEDHDLKSKQTLSIVYNSTKFLHKVPKFKFDLDEIAKRIRSLLPDCQLTRQQIQQKLINDKLKEHTDELTQALKENLYESAQIIMKIVDANDERIIRVLTDSNILKKLQALTDK